MATSTSTSTSTSDRITCVLALASGLAWHSSVFAQPEEPAVDPAEDSADEVELGELESELRDELGQEPPGGGPTTHAPAAGASTGGPSASELGRVALLPDLSAVGTVGLFYFSDRPSPRLPAHEPTHSRDGFKFQLQELEIALQAAVDPYVRADLFLALGLEGIELEEAYVTTLSLPANLQARVGWFFTELGRFNTQHFLEVSPFVDMPLVNRRFFGGEQLRGLGVELSWLSPLPWFAEVTIDFTTANNEVSLGIPVRETGGVEDFLVVGRLEQFFELSATWSLLWGLSGAHAGNASGGPQATDDNRTSFGGTDIYLKWRDLESVRYVALQTEYILRSALVPEGRITEGGIYAFLDARVHKHWQVAARFDYFGFPSETSGRIAFAGELLQWHRPSEQWRIGAAISYYVSEFQRLRLQYNLDRQLGNENRFAMGDDLFVMRRAPVHEAFLQYQFVMGSHGAHPF